MTNPHFKCVTNKGCEISLQSMGFCNLTEVNCNNIKDLEDLKCRVSAAAFLGTLQASYTDFFYLRPEWKKNAEQDALLGVSLTGIASLPDYISDKDLGDLANIAINENRATARMIKINPAKRVTCVKPSGTTSLVVGSSSGIHAWYAPFYIRRMRLNKEEALYKYILNELPDLVEDDVRRPHDTAVLSVPMKAPEGAVLRSETAYDTLERVKRFSRFWVAEGHVEGLNRHNVSCTINVKPKEWKLVSDWMWANRKMYTGISLLPYDNGTYVQAPFEETTEEIYKEMLEKVKSIDLSQVIETEDNTNLIGELACSGGSCEIK